MIYFFPQAREDDLVSLYINATIIITAQAPETFPFHKLLMQSLLHEAYREFNQALRTHTSCSESTYSALRNANLKPVALCNLTKV